MDNTQAYLIIDKVKRLWQAWKPTEDEQTLYCRKLTAFDYDLVSEAVEEHKTTKEGSNLNPKLYHILNICKGKDVGEKKKSRAVICYFIECIENEDSPHLVGKKIPFYAPSKEEAYRGRLQEKSAEKSADYCRGGGGTWIPRLINFDISE